MYNTIILVAFYCMYKTITCSKNTYIICAKGLDVRVSVLYNLKFLVFCSCVCVCVCA